MKTWKHCSFVLAILMAIFCLSFMACGDDPSNTETTQQPKAQSQMITFGSGFSTTVTGTMTDTDWGIAVPKLTDVLNSTITGGGLIEDRCVSLFSGVITGIDLVKTQNYQYYKIDNEFFKILLNADFAISSTQANLREKFVAIINACYSDAPLQE